ncbi:DUF3150 domain-containing protein [Terasakiella pusilla]|uniref:DUF3150 domain-containing protein n=1 Tax=Terasakiella pusilla TaxID=64973 RepID=UPI003AA7C3C5
MTKTSLNSDVTVLQSLIAVRLDVSIWSARKKLTALDFGEISLPPEKLASLGSKKICDPDTLKVFSALKSRAVALLSRVGIRFLGGWAVPESRLQEVIDGLKAIEQEFGQAKDDFLAHYDEAVRRWIADNPGWEEVISRSVVGVSTVRSRIEFGWQVFQVVPPKKSMGTQCQDKLVAEVSSLGGTLFQEVAKAANETWLKSYAGKTEVGQKALSPLTTLRRKLAGLSFVEPKVFPIVELIDTAIAQLPAKGQIGGRSFVMLQGLVCLLRDADALATHGQMMIEGQTSDDILQGLLSVNPDDEEVLDQANERDCEEPCSGDIQYLEMSPAPQLDSYGLW